MAYTALCYIMLAAGVPVCDCQPQTGTPAASMQDRAELTKH